ncbi:hypothetical protein [Rhodococcus sp. ACPA1]|uniref:hypothetical protein n=1 Tax=Rhodococcus sp. ACPA1 TaxID=2028572 RepID=UPI000BB0EF90|nr:hypothetical protein [Rhodococcus sp. ACPA1]PBC51502.1 hypothetical protein CJ177_33950 [Rhodococcus sp. ACPA1]
MSRFLRLTLAAAATAAAAMSLTAAPAHAAPPPVPSGCDIQFFVVGAMSTCAPGSVNTHQLELVCWNLGLPARLYAWGPEVPTFLPSIALCPILGYTSPAPVTRVHTR